MSLRESLDRWPLSAFWSKKGQGHKIKKISTILGHDLLSINKNAYARSAYTIHPQNSTPSFYDAIYDRITTDQTKESQMNQQTEKIEQYIAQAKELNLNLSEDLIEKVTISLWPSIL